MFSSVKNSLVHKSNIKIKALLNILEVQKNITELNKLSDCINNLIQIRDGEVVNLTPQDNTALARISIIVNYLNSLHFEPTHVIIEYQMSANHKMNVVSTMLMTYFTITMPAIKIIVINPGYKNKISFGIELDYSAYSSKYATSYTANKKHTLDNYMWWITHFPSNIRYFDPKLNGHIADSFMQVLGWYYLYN